ncbi:hypothetical protein RJ641_010872 [Dillenia turbinata]|uniref:Uncharacterized protein n=1 Tax=Dillenia turbinata TaxID=194707 RepID=A0AAN8USS1_9MAGN
MGKRNAVVVLSSDAEKEDWKPNKRSRSRLSSSVPQAYSKVAKRKKKVLLSCSVPRSRSSRVDRIEHFGDEFDEAFRAFNGSTGNVKSQSKELWVDKYKPQSPEELAIHKKKVEEAKMRFEQRLRTPKILCRDENRDDVWAVASYLSEADFLLASSHEAITRSYEAKSVLQSTATSVAVRGVLLGNANPLFSRSDIGAYLLSINELLMGKD